MWVKGQMDPKFKYQVCLVFKVGSIINKYINIKDKWLCCRALSVVLKGAVQCVAAGKCQGESKQLFGYMELSKVLKPPQTLWTSLEEQTGEWRLRGLRGGTVQGNESLRRLSFQHCLPSHSWGQPLPDCLLISFIICNWVSHLPWMRLTGFLCLQTGPPSRN